MYVYQVGYYTHEESPRYNLTHEVKYSKKQFDDMVIDIMSDLAIKVPITTFDFDDGSKSEDRFDSVENILTETIEILKSNSGFKDLIITSSFTPFGWASINDKTDWRGQRGKDLDKITKRVKEKLNINNNNNI